MTRYTTEDDFQTIRDTIEYAGHVHTVWQRGEDRRLAVVCPKEPLHVIGDLVQATQGDLERVEELAQALQSAHISTVHEHTYLHFPSVELFEYEQEDD